MADISKPVYGEVWANAGERLLPPATKIENGWIQEMMPFQYENWIQHRQDMALVYLFQKGVSEWSSEQEYIADKSVVTYLGNLYMATLTNTNVVPSMTTSWKRLNSTASPDGVISIAGGGTGANSAGAARTNLGLGTMATQNANAVAITGGTITSITAAGAFTGNLAGNAATATAMQTARSFALTGAALADPVSFNATANVLLNVLSLDATKLTGVATINTTGNAATATVLQTARTITLSGAATGSPTSFNGSGDISIPVVSLNATDLLTGTVPTARLGNAVTKTSATGSAQIPVGTTAQRDASPVVGSLRFNSSNSNLMEYWNGASWITSNGTDLGGLIGPGASQISTNAMNDARYQSLTAAATMSVADRDRANHTGTQPQLTIEGLVPRLTTIETNLDSLGINKQDKLVSGTNIKTINGESLLGPGNITVITTIDAIRRPTNVSPASSATGIESKPVLTGSPFYSLYGVAMSAGNWQVSLSPDFISNVVNTGDIGGTSTTYTVPAGILNVNTVYHWRVRYKDAEGQYSEWSVPTSFTTNTTFNAYIDVPAPTPASVGDAFEGGFYTGLIWNEIAKSSTNHTSTTGVKVFVVPDMTNSPIVYAGQEVQVRSRDNAEAYRLTGTVVAALGTNLTINVTTVEGSVAHSDWSIMAKYRVIVSPKYFGEVSARPIKNDNTAVPLACQTLTEGFLSTEGMRLAGNATVYPAAHWARGLNIGGKTDWYIPSRDELELAYRNLKPTTGGASGNTRPIAFEYNYSTSGAVGTSSAAQGENKNSFPVGTAYTGGNPAQTSITVFKDGGPEAFSAGTYITSSTYSSVNDWIQYFSSGSNSGRQETQVHSSATSSVRAFRRSII